MKSRQEIKAIAKQNFKKSYGINIGVYIVYAIVISAVSGITFGLGSIFIALPLSVGLAFFSLCVYRAQELKFESMFTVGFTEYGRKLGGMLWMELFTFLWSLLFVIPGIVKMYAYSLTPYILADHPNVLAKDALKISMLVTKGHKGELFVMNLSFIGWMLLSGLTCGLLYILYVGPYIYATCAGYYEELMNNALTSGVISKEELRDLA